MKLEKRSMRKIGVHCVLTGDDKMGDILEAKMCGDILAYILASETDLDDLPVGSIKEIANLLIAYGWRYDAANDVRLAQEIPEVIEEPQDP